MEETGWECYDSLKEARKDLKELKREWKKLKANTEFKFADFTEDKLSEIEFWLFGSDLDEFTRIIKAQGIANNIRKVHFAGRLRLESVLSYSNTSDKIVQFTKYCNELTDKEYWKNLSFAYIMQDYNEVPYQIVSELFEANRTNRECLMNDSELEYFKSLPETIKIYRAMTLTEKESLKYRFSWTLNNKVAQKFYERNSILCKDEMTIHEIIVNKKDVIAYLNEREEEEIIYIYP